MAQVNRQLTGTGNFGSAVVDLYDFSLDLSSSFDVEAGKRYWFSVTSKAGDFSPFFSWTNADGSGTAFQRQLDGAGAIAGSFVRGGDRAFSLESKELPEPASLALVGAALLAGAMASRRRTA